MTPKDIYKARRFCGGAHLIHTEDDAASASVTLEDALDTLEGIWEGTEPVQVHPVETVTDVYQLLVDWCRRNDIEEPVRLHAPATVDGWEKRAHVLITEADWNRLGIRPVVERGEVLIGSHDGVKVKTVPQATVERVTREAVEGAAA